MIDIYEIYKDIYHHAGIWNLIRRDHFLGPSGREIFAERVFNRALTFIKRLSENETRI